MTLKLVTYNCKNFKTNNLYLKQLFEEFDVCFLTEHWLNSQEKYIIEDTCVNKNIFFQAYFSLQDSFEMRGRPFH